MTAFKFNQTELSPYHIVIIGSGPNSVYAMDRIAALCLGRPDLNNFHVHVFDRKGLFGCGEVHDINQPKTSLLNRIVGQVSFGCNFDTPGANHVLPSEHRFTFMEWINKKYQETGDHQYQMNQDEWPPRYIHGLALQDAFFNCIKIIESRNISKVSLYAKEVIDVEIAKGGEIFHRFR